jgi:hypothetical protein
MLEVIEDQQHPACADACPEYRSHLASVGVLESQRVDDRSTDQIRIANVSQRDEMDAREHTLHGDADRDGQARFADPARAGQCYQPDIVPQQQCANLLNLSLATDEGRALE